MKLTEIKDLDPIWNRLEPALEDEIRNSPKLLKLAKVIAQTILHDGENPIKILLRMSGGSRSKGLELAIGNLKDDFKKKYSKDDIDFVFDWVMAAATDGTEYEWERE